MSNQRRLRRPPHRSRPRRCLRPRRSVLRHPLRRKRLSSRIRPRRLHHLPSLPRRLHRARSTSGSPDRTTGRADDIPGNAVTMTDRRGPTRATSPATGKEPRTAASGWRHTGNERAARVFARRSRVTAARCWTPRPCRWPWAIGTRCHCRWGPSKSAPGRCTSHFWPPNRQIRAGRRSRCRTCMSR